MVRFFFIQAIASLGCWTDIQTVHVRVSKPWAVAARQQFDASKTKHMRFLQEARSPLFFREIESCLIVYIDSWLMFLHPKHQIFNFIQFLQMVLVWVGILPLVPIKPRHPLLRWSKNLRNSALDRIRQKNAMRWMLLRRSHTNFRCLKTTWVHWGNLTYKRSPKRTKTRHKKATPSISPKRKFIKIHFWTFWASSLPQSCFKACTRWITSWKNWLLNPVQLVPDPNDPKFLMCSLHSVGVSTPCLWIPLKINLQWPWVNSNTLRIYG